MGVTRARLGRTGLETPPIVFGSSALGNLYRELSYEHKRRIVSAWFESTEPPVFIDSAGKYGAGLALELIGRILAELDVSPNRVVVSNKLGWRRVPLTTSEPLFEPGVWFGLEHDAHQTIGYDGILDCWEQGCRLLGRYRPALVSIHDPDEYLDAASGSADRERRMRDILSAYRALIELRDAGEVVGVGVGSKDRNVVRELCERVDLDWIMLACSLTIRTHNRELLDFLADVRARGIGVINSAVFHSGFLVGGRYYDYRVVSRRSHPELFEWRDRFTECCVAFDVTPLNACVEFGLSVPGVAAVALNTGRPERVAENVEAATSKAPRRFWRRMKEIGLVDPDFPYL